MVNMVTAKSSMESVKARMKPLIMPGNISGRITLRNAWKGVAPRSRAASYTFWFIFFKRGITLSTT